MDNKIPIVIFNMNEPRQYSRRGAGAKNRHPGLRLEYGRAKIFSMSSDDILLEAEMAMEKSVDYMVHEFAAVRTGKASPALVENVDVQAYGSAMKLKQLALITTPEPRLLVVQPFDAGTVRDIEKALNESTHRHNPIGGWENHSSAHSGVVRGTPQRSGPFAGQDGGGSARARAREPARCAG